MADSFHLSVGSLERYFRDFTVAPFLFRKGNLGRRLKVTRQGELRGNGTTLCMPLYGSNSIYLASRDVTWLGLQTFINDRPEDRSSSHLGTKTAIKATFRDSKTLTLMVAMSTGVLNVDWCIKSQLLYQISTGVSIINWCIKSKWCIKFQRAYGMSTGVSNIKWCMKCQLVYQISRGESVVNLCIQFLQVYQK